MSKERQTPLSTEVISPDQREAVRNEILALLPLQAQKDKIRPLINKLIDTNSAVEEERTIIYGKFKDWYECNIRDGIDTKQLFYECAKKAIEKYLDREMGINPRLLIGMEGVRLADIAQAVADDFPTLDLPEIPDLDELLERAL